MLLVDHFLSIERQGSQFSHSFVTELYPSFLKADPLVATLLGPVFPKPFTFLQQINPFHTIPIQQFPNVVRFHVGWYSRNVADSLGGLLLLVCFDLFWGFRSGFSVGDVLGLLLGFRFNWVGDFGLRFHCVGYFMFLEMLWLG